MANVLKLNEPLSFGSSGSIKGFNSFGFDLGEPSASWTIDETAGFTIGGLAGNMPADPKIRLVITAAPFLHPDYVVRQQFFVFINGLHVGFRTLLDAERVEFLLPRYVLSTRSMRIEFVIPTAVSPQSVGLSPDVRKLGIAISDVSFKLET